MNFQRKSDSVTAEEKIPDLIELASAVAEAASCGPYILSEAILRFIEAVYPEASVAAHVLAVSRLDGQSFSVPQMGNDFELLGWAVASLESELALGSGPAAHQSPEKQGSSLISVPCCLRQGDALALWAGRLHWDEGVNLEDINYRLEKTARIFSTGSVLPATGMLSGPESPHQVLTSLSLRQRIILNLMAQGLTNKQIAEEIRFSDSTVRLESMAIYRRLGISGRKEAASYMAVARVTATEDWYNCA